MENFKETQFPIICLCAHLGLEQQALLRIAFVFYVPMRQRLYLDEAPVVERVATPTDDLILKQTFETLRSQDSLDERMVFALESGDELIMVENTDLTCSLWIF